MLIAHISDLHFRTLRGVKPWDFFGQRILGGLNLLFNRAPEFPEALIGALFDDLNRVRPDHVVVSGDLSNLALLGELELARETLLRLELEPANITVVPGNHDAYTRRAASGEDFSRVMAPFVDGELKSPDARAFPFVKLRGNVAILALSTAVHSPPVMAWGTLGPDQLRFAEELLGHPDVRRRFRLVVMHHPPRSPYARWNKHLTDGEAFIQMIGRVGADLIVHGHLHREVFDEIDGPDGRRVPILGITSSTWLSREPDRRSRYNLYEIDADGRLARVISRRFDEQQGLFIEGGSQPMLEAAQQA